MFSATDKLADLKSRFFDIEGMAVGRQNFYCGFSRLEDDSVLLQNLIEISPKLDVKLPKVSHS